MRSAEREGEVAVLVRAAKAEQTRSGVAPRSEAQLVAIIVSKSHLDLLARRELSMEERGLLDEYLAEQDATRTGASDATTARR